MGIYTQAVKNLDPDEYKRIEDDHLRLRNSINNLRSTCRNMDGPLGCQNCSREQIGACQGRLTSFYHNIVSISTDHFEFEEYIMRRVSPSVEKDMEFKVHQKAHLNILKELQAAVSQCAAQYSSSDVAMCYRQLFTKTSELYEEHERLFDDV